MSAFPKGLIYPCIQGKELVGLTVHIAGAESNAEASPVVMLTVEQLEEALRSYRKTEKSLQTASKSE